MRLFSPPTKSGFKLPARRQDIHFRISRGAVAARALSSLITYSGLLDANALDLTEHAWNYFTGAETEINYAERRHHASDPKISSGLWDAVTGPYKVETLRERYQLHDLSLSRQVKAGVHILSLDETRGSFAPLLFSRCDAGQTLEQIWMPGVHGDIGGGYGKAFLSTMSLLIMIDRFKTPAARLVYRHQLHFDEADADYQK